MTVFATTTAAAREAALVFRRRKRGQMNSWHELSQTRTGLIYSSNINAFNTSARARSAACTESTPRLWRQIGVMRSFILRKGQDAPVGVAGITHRRVRPPVCASRTETCWNPAGMDGGRAGRDADAGGRGAFCVRFSPRRCCVCC